jgi:hypothetical protein
LLLEIKLDCAVVTVSKLQSPCRAVPWRVCGPQVTAAIVTCGGLCPGLNDVVQNIVFTLTDYGVPEDQILGIRYGLRGKAPTQ